MHIKVAVMNSSNNCNLFYFRFQIVYTYNKKTHKEMIKSFPAGLCFLQNISCLQMFCVVSVHTSFTVMNESVYRNVTN